jgi:hypothetical protein
MILAGIFVLLLSSAAASIDGPSLADVKPAEVREIWNLTILHLPQLQTMIDRCGPAVQTGYISATEYHFLLYYRWHLTNGMAYFFNPKKLDYIADDCIAPYEAAERRIAVRRSAVDESIKDDVDRRIDYRVLPLSDPVRRLLS